MVGTPMRPAARKQGAFRAPLNEILGTEASVRILRVLATASVPYSRRDLAREAALYPGGIPRVLDQLENLGVIERIGRSRSQPIRLRAQYPLSHELRQLFQKEAQRVAEVKQRIANTINQLGRVDAAWIEGPAATGNDEASDPITVGIIPPSDYNEQWEQHVRVGFNAIQSQYDIAIEMRVRTRADILTANERELATLRNVRPLIGPPPLDLLGQDAAIGPSARSAVTHETRDAESLAYARAIAAKLKAKPDLVDDAIRFIERRVHTASHAEALALTEWRDILSTYSMGRLRSFLVSNSTQAQRLRQSMPFADALSDDERRQARDSA
jgi:hypothetical protein